MGIEFFCNNLVIRNEIIKDIISNFSSISKIEAGIRAVSTEEILYLSYALDKPIMYFYPKEFSFELSEDELSILEKELLIYVRHLERDDMRRLIAQARALVEFGYDN